MPLVAMSDYVGELEEANFSLAIPGQYPLGINGLGEDASSPFGPLAYNPDAMIAPPTLPKYVFNTPPSTPVPAAPGSSSTAKQIVDSITAAAVAFAPMFKKESKPKIVVQKDPDYTTYAVIGGAVVVASILAIAIGKSGGRRRD